MPKRYSIAFIIMLLVLAAATFQTGSASAGSSPERYIIFTENQAANDFAAEEVVKKGGAVLKSLGAEHQKGLVVQINQSTKDDIAAMQGVKAVEPDVTISAIQSQKMDKAPSGISMPEEELPWGIEMIKANEVWDADVDLAVDAGANAGAGVKVAIVDSGIDKNHPDLADNLAGGINFVVGSSDNSNSHWDDFYGHGTLVAGICAAVDNKTGVIGVAPYARLYSVRVLDKDGRGYLSDLIEAMYWCGDNGMNIANFSVGVPKEVLGENQNSVFALNEAAEYAYGKGVLLIAAAGNLGQQDDPPAEPGGNVEYPARLKSVMAVAAIDESGNWWPFSKMMPSVAIAAPGVNVESTFLKGSYLDIATGTSFAAPHVSGAAALVIATDQVTDINDKNGIADEVREILCNTATLINDFDFGTVNAAKAVDPSN